jgi:hypothetical protein
MIDDGLILLLCSYNSTRFHPTGPRLDAGVNDNVTRNPIAHDVIPQKPTLYGNELVP